jgi:hypothetical protein
MMSSMSHSHPDNFFTKLLSTHLHGYNPYYNTGKTAIYNEDCLTILRAIPGNSIKMIFADPPYFLSNNGVTCPIRGALCLVIGFAGYVCNQANPLIM